MRIKTATELGELTRDRRKARGWSQSQLAEAANVSRLWVGQFENGKESVEIGLVLATLRALGIALEATIQTSNPFPGGPLG